MTRVYGATQGIRTTLGTFDLSPKNSINIWSSEILLHFGIWLLVLQPAIAGVVSNRAQAALYGSIVGPLFISLLLFFVSGVPTAEKPVQKKHYLMQHGPKAVEDRQPWDDYKVGLFPAWSMSELMLRVGILEKHKHFLPYSTCYLPSSTYLGQDYYPARFANVPV